MSLGICGRHLTPYSPQWRSCCSSPAATWQIYYSLGLPDDVERSRCEWRSVRHVEVLSGCFSWKVSSLVSSPDSRARSSPGRSRSEERRVGKECRSRGSSKQKTAYEMPK